MAWPFRGQKAPDFWDDDLKAYIDEGNPAVEGSEAEASVAASYAPIVAKTGVPPNTVALLGASITDQNGVGDGTLDPVTAFPYNHSQGYFVWANASLGGRLKLLRNAGVAGQTSSQILARVTDVTNLSELPGYCIVSDAASNDILNDVPAATIIANLDAIYNALRAKGITVVACTMPDIWTNVPARRAIESEVNQWICDRAGLPGFIVCDFNDVWAADAGGPRNIPGWAPDGIHPSPGGAGLLGKRLADAIRPYIGGSVNLPTSGQDSLNVLENGMMSGTAGALGAGCTGQLATSWLAGRLAGAGTIALAKVARTDGIGGAWQEIALAGGGGTFIVYQNPAVAGLAVGQKWIAELEYSALTPTGIDVFDLVIATVGGGGAGATALENGVAGQLYPADVPAGVIRTPVMTIQSAGATSLNVIVNLQGTAGSVRVSRIRARRVE